MPTNEGFFKEDEMVYRLNGTKIKDLSNNLRNFIHAMFGVIDDEEIVYAEKLDNFIKPDFKVTYKNESRYISMKSGRCETVHQELIKSFILFLRDLGVSKRTQATILLWQYGDGTMDGTGKKRYEYDELHVMLKERIKEANEELNESPEFVEKVMEHCIFYGTQENAIMADGVYHGDCNYGNLATRKQIIRHIRKKRFKWDNISHLHIGPLRIRPHARYVDKPIANPKSRHKVEMYWTHLDNDIEYISHRYDY